MTFANPTLLWWLLLLLVVPLLHLARRRPRRVLTPHVFLWERVLRQGQKTRIVRFKNWLLMLLQMLAIATIVFLFARPETERAERVPRSTLLLIDLSPTMMALNRDGSTRLEQAVRRARDELDALLEDGPVALGSLGDSPRVLLPFGSGRESITASLDGLLAEWTLADVRLINALALAASADRIWLITDRAFAGVLPDGIEVLRVGDRTDNAGIVGARLAEDRGDGGVVVHVELNTHNLKRDVKVLAYQNGELIGSSAQLAPFDGEVSFAVEAHRGSFLELRLQVDGGDALALDNTVSIYWPEDPPFRVLVVANSVAPEHLDGLAALSEVCRIEAADHVKPERWREVMDGYDLIILDGLREKLPLPPAHYLLIDSYAPELPVKALEESEEVVFLRRRDDVGILRGIALEDLNAKRATRVEIGEGATCVVEGSIGPLITTRLEAPVSFVHLSFDISTTNASLALMDAWPLLLRDVLRVMHPTRQRLYAGLASIGGDLVPTRVMPEGARARPNDDGALRSLNDGASWPLSQPVAEGVFSLPGVKEGEYEVVFPGRQERIGMAPLSRGLADVSPRLDDPVLEWTEPLTVVTTRDYRDLLCAIALLLLAVEWFLYQRGWAS